MTLSSIDQLLIRACKSKNPKKRLQSIYKRNYYYSEEYKVFRKNMIYILSNLFSKINKKEIPLYEMFRYLEPNRFFWEKESEYDFSEKCLDLLISKIRFIEVSDLPNDFRIPSRFRQLGD